MVRENTYVRTCTLLSVWMHLSLYIIYMLAAAYRLTDSPVSREEPSDVHGNFAAGCWTHLDVLNLSGRAGWIFPAVFLLSSAAVGWKNRKKKSGVRG